MFRQSKATFGQNDNQKAKQKTTKCTIKHSLETVFCWFAWIFALGGTLNTQYTKYTVQYTDTKYSLNTLKIKTKLKLKKKKETKGWLTWQFYYLNTCFTICKKESVKNVRFYTPD